MTPEDALSKVRALLAKTTGRGATDAEQDAAMSKVQELLIKYNLSLGDVKTDEAASTQSAESVGKFAEEFRESKSTGSWKATLANACGTNNFCKCVCMQGRAGVWFIGTPTNVKAATDLWKYLLHQTNLACMAAYQDSWRDVTPAKYAKEFYWGAVTKLVTRLREAKNAAMASKPQWYAASESDYHSATTALVVSNQNQIQAFVAREFPNLAHGRCSTRVSTFGPGYTAGQRAASGMSLGQTGRISGGRLAIGAN